MTQMNQVRQYKTAPVIDMNQSRRAKQRKNHYKKAMLIFTAIILGIILATVLSHSMSSAQNAHNSYKYYTSVEILPGDSLWSVADQYMTNDYHDKNSYINEVMEINHMTDTALRVGDSITVPYYSEVQKQIPNSLS